MDAQTKTKLGNRITIKDIEIKINNNKKTNMGIIVGLILIVNIMILGSVREILKYIKDKIK